MAVKIGVHTGPQDLSMDELTTIWERADKAGFDWISVWDHFYPNPLVDRKNPCFEGVAAMAALAAVAKNVRVGCYMFNMLHRNPLLLAKSMVTIDHFSKGRVNVGLGGGWFEEEMREYGYGFPPIKERLDQMEEGLQIMKQFFTGNPVHFKGTYYDIQGAVCSPLPVGAMKLWIGGRGLKRMPRMAGQYADGFNLPYVSVADFKDRNQKVDAAAEKFGREPASIERSVNLGFYMSKDEAKSRAAVAQVVKLKPEMEGGLLWGTPAMAIDQIGEFEKAGAQGVNIAFRPPLDWDAIEGFISEVLPHFK